MKKELTKEEIKQLVESYVAYKKAEDEFKSLKDNLTKDLENGSFVSEIGKVMKSTSKSKCFNTSAFKSDNPDIYEEYLDDMEISESLSVEDVEPIWKQMALGAKREFIRECALDETVIILIPEIVGYIKTEFDKIFDRYGLWYDFGFSWSLTCYKK